MASVELLQCYNKGCGKKYNPQNNKEGDCQYHSGVPVFHDALKGWSCCKKRSTDFTEFLNMPGCTHGLHSNDKPEPEKPEVDTSQKNETVEIDIRPPIPPVNRERPSTEEPLIRLKFTVGASLQQALEKQIKEMTIETDKVDEVDPLVVKVGTSCKNAGCTKDYVDDSSNAENCIHHSGFPIFHEGMKYWSCCKRKTSDFNSFLSQEGCTTGKHVWLKKESAEKKVACRHDWHQTGSFVIISIFAKLAVPSSSWVEANQVSAKIKLMFDGGKSNFEHNIILNGVIDPEQSNVRMLGSKVEISLKKKEPGSWPKLELVKAANS